VSAIISWSEGEQIHHARWRSENGISSHQKLVIAGDTVSADTAYRLACEGTALLWRGDFQNARQLLQALARRLDKPSKKSKRNLKAGKQVSEKSPVDVFNLHRLARSQRARILGMLLVQCEAGHRIALRRAPDIQQACLEAYGPSDETYLVSLRELLGVISAHEWRKQGVLIPGLSVAEEIRIHPHYGVFSPIRGEYVDLVCQAPLPRALAKQSLAFDIGVGTGILSFALAKRGITKIIASDQDERALACAIENRDRLGLRGDIEVVKANLFPEGQAALIVCNPPWLPAKPSSPLEHAVYDPDSRMLKGFLGGLGEHLLPEGEGWLILSDLAEHLGLRSRQQLLDWIDQSGLTVIGRLDTKPKHQKVFDKSDALHTARAAEVTSLWRLARR